MGDILFALPIVADIKFALPHAEIDWVVDARFSELIQNVNGLRKVIAVDLKDRKRLGAFKTLKSIIRTIREVRKTRYDFLIDIHGVFKSGLFSFLSGAAERWCYPPEKMSERHFFWAYNRRFKPVGKDHPIIHYRALTAQVFSYELRTPIDFGFKFDNPALPHLANDAYLSARKSVSSQLKCFTQELTRSELLERHVFFFPFSSKKEKWLNLKQCLDICSLMQELGLTICIPSGSYNEVNYARKIVDQSNAKLLSPLSIAEFVNVFPHIRFYLGTDTGLSHLAAACGVKTIVFFTATDAATFGPERWAKHAISLNSTDPNMLVKVKGFLQS